MTVKEFYDSIGGSYDVVSSQLMKDERITKFVKRFPIDPTYKNLVESLNKDDYDTAFRMAHTLKGVAANLAFVRFQEASSNLTEILREKNIKEAKSAFELVKVEYEQLLKGIERLD